MDRIGEEYYVLYESRDLIVEISPNFKRLMIYGYGYKMETTRDIMHGGWAWRLI